MKGNGSVFEEAIVNELFGPFVAAATAIAVDVEPVATQLGLWQRPDRWQKRWTVPSRTVAGARHTVACTASGEWGCSCGAWIYHRRRCWHIDRVTARLGA